MGGVWRKLEGKGDRLGVWVNFGREPVNSTGRQETNGWASRRILAEREREGGRAREINSG